MPAGPIAVTTSDYIVVDVTTQVSKTNWPVNIYLRMLDTAGNPHSYTFMDVYTGSGFIAPIAYQIPINGTLVGLAVQPMGNQGGGGPLFGDVYFIVSLIRVPQWQANNTYMVNSLIVDSNGNWQQVTSTTGSNNTGASGSTQPTWSTTSGGTTTDNQLTWKEYPASTSYTSLFASPVPGLALIAGTCTSAYQLSWPESGVKQPLDQHGLIQIITVSDPGAGNNWSYSISSFYRYKLLGVQYKLTTSSTAGNRFAMVYAGNGGMSIVSDTPQPPSTTFGYTFAPGVGSVAGVNNGGWVFLPLPDECRLFNNDTLQSAVLPNIQSGDTIFQIRLRFEIWHELD